MYCEAVQHDARAVSQGDGMRCCPDHHGSLSATVLAVCMGSLARHGPGEVGAEVGRSALIGEARVFRPDGSRKCSSAAAKSASVIASRLQRMAMFTCVSLTTLRSRAAAEQPESAGLTATNAAKPELSERNGCVSKRAFSRFRSRALPPRSNKTRSDYTRWRHLAVRGTDFIVQTDAPASGYGSDGPLRSAPGGDVPAARGGAMCRRPGSFTEDGRPDGRDPHR